VSPARALFVCTRNSARSQLAAALWRSLAGAPAESAGTHPADRVHPGAIAAAKRAGLDITGYTPRALDRVGRLPGIVVTVCDQAHEELAPDDTWLHWSVSDPVAAGSRAAFDAALTELRERIGALVADARVAS
jgi:protein-tyrosine-phosphatase